VKYVKKYILEHKDEHPFERIKASLKKAKVPDYIIDKAFKEVFKFN